MQNISIVVLFEKLVHEFFSYWIGFFPSKTLRCCRMFIDTVFFSSDTGDVYCFFFLFCYRFVNSTKSFRDTAFCFTSSLLLCFRYHWNLVSFIFFLHFAYFGNIFLTTFLTLRYIFLYLKFNWGVWCLFFLFIKFPFDFVDFLLEVISIRLHSP